MHARNESSPMNLKVGRVCPQRAARVPIRSPGALGTDAPYQCPFVVPMRVKKTSRLSITVDCKPTADDSPLPFRRGEGRGEGSVRSSKVHDPQCIRDTKGGFP